MPSQNGDDVYEYRSEIAGIDHCPCCGGMLWPPEYTDELVTEDGTAIDSVLDAGDETVIHRNCYETKLAQSSALSESSG